MYQVPSQGSIHNPHSTPNSVNMLPMGHAIAQEAVALGTPSPTPMAAGQTTSNASMAQALSHPPQSHGYQLTVKDKFTLHAAVMGLYRDQIKPHKNEVQRRLQELNATPHVQKHFLTICEDLPAVYNVVRISATLVDVFLCQTPTWFAGWVDPKDLADPYSADTWESLKLYLKSLVDQAQQEPLGKNPKAFQLSGGRYAVAKQLKLSGPQSLSPLSLGQLCHLVQLAVHKNWLRFAGAYLEPSHLVSPLMPVVANGQQQQQQPNQHQHIQQQQQQHGHAQHQKLNKHHQHTHQQNLQLNQHSHQHNHHSQMAPHNPMMSKYNGSNNSISGMVQQPQMSQMPHMHFGQLGTMNSYRNFGENASSAASGPDCHNPAFEVDPFRPHPRSNVSITMAQDVASADVFLFQQQLQQQQQQQQLMYMQQQQQQQQQHSQQQMNPVLMHGYKSVSHGNLAYLAQQQQNAVNSAHAQSMHGHHTHSHPNMYPQGQEPNSNMAVMYSETESRWGAASSQNQTRVHGFSSEDEASAVYWR